MPNPKTFTVDTLVEPMRIDLYLISQMPELTRTSAKKIIMEGFLSVDQKNIKPNFRVSGGEVVSVDTDKAEVLLNKGEFAKLQPVKMNLDIVYEDNYLIALNKSSGQVVHPVTGHTNDTLMNGLLYAEMQKAKKGEQVNRIRPIHRLDKDTSGVILFSRDKTAHEFYSKLFESRAIEKTYFAVVSGNFGEYLEEKTNKDYFEIFTYISRSTLDKKQFYNAPQEKGLPARTRVYFEKLWEHPVKKGRTYSLLKLVPETGRTHQLRVHLEGIGFPILGDTIYEGENFSRLMLHAQSIKFDHYPDKKHMELVAKLPKEFQN